MKKQALEKIGKVTFDPRTTFEDYEGSPARCSMGNDDEGCVLMIRLGTKDDALAVRRARGIIQRWQGGPNTLLPVVKLEQVSSWRKPKK